MKTQWALWFADKETAKKFVLKNNWNNEDWFKTRIGKTIWRNKTSCTCGVCEAVYRKGLYVQDDFHASYLSDVVAEETQNGWPMMYFDTKAERDFYEQSIQQQPPHRA